MSVSGNRLEMRIRKALRAKIIITNRSENAEINEQLGIALNIKTNNQITDDVKAKLDSFVKQQASARVIIDKIYPTGGNPELRSNLIKPTKINTNKQGYFRVLLSDSIAVAYFRFDSKDSALRDELIELLSSNHNNHINSVIGSKHTAVGLLTRLESDIKQMDENLLFDIVVQIYSLLF